MTYRLAFTAREIAALGWIADRYESAAVLYDGLVALDERDWDEVPEHQERPYELPEYIAWAFRDAVEREDAQCVPCAGGTLAEKIHRLLEEIV